MAQKQNNKMWFGTNVASGEQKMVPDMASLSLNSASHNCSNLSSSVFGQGNSSQAQASPEIFQCFVGDFFI